MGILEDDFIYELNCYAVYLYGAKSSTPQKTAICIVGENPFGVKWWLPIPFGIRLTRGHMELLPRVQGKRTWSNLCFVCTCRFNSWANIKHIRNCALPWWVYINYSLMPSVASGAGAAFDAFWYRNDIPCAQIWKQFVLHYYFIDLIYYTC